MNPREAIPKAKAAAQKALALDGTLAEAHASLAFISYVYDFDWAVLSSNFGALLNSIQTMQLRIIGTVSF